jgi:hypothetical protein
LLFCPPNKKSGPPDKKSGKILARSGEICYICSNQSKRQEIVMNEAKPSQWTARASYGAALLFAIHLVTYFIPAIRDVTTSSSILGAEALALLAVAEHLILFPVIATLPAPKWARAVGYGWLVLDIATDIMQLNGVVKMTYLSLRYGANVAAALWIASAAWQAKGAVRVIGVIVALDLAVYSFIAFIPLTFLVLVPSLVLLPLWFFLVGRLVARGDGLQQRHVSLQFEQAPPFDLGKDR